VILDTDGAVVSDAEIRRRIEHLAIPPAWRNVWITPFSNGHLQAVGTDDAGRRQYLYHPDWQANRNRLKYQRVLELGAALPGARTRIADALTAPSLSRDRALATAFRLLDCGHFRIGGAVYAEANGSFGLSTLRRDHVHRREGALVFRYTAKSGIEHIERIADPVLVENVGAMLRRRGGDVDELLGYREGRSWRRLTGDDINAYVKDVVRLDVSAKDFRTWHGTVLGAVAVADESLRHPADKPWSTRARNQAVRRAVAAVAENLGNTPAVCRGSYINPRVVELFTEGTTIERTVARAARQLAPDPAVDRRIPTEALTTIGALPAVERAVLRLLAE